jgi:hypothetical protein
MIYTNGGALEQLRVVVIVQGDGECEQEVAKIFARG